MQFNIAVLLLILKVTQKLTFIKILLLFLPKQKLTNNMKRKNCYFNKPQRFLISLEFVFPGNK